MLSGRGDARGPKEFRASVARQVIVNLMIRSDYAYRTISTKYDLIGWRALPWRLYTVHRTLEYNRST